MKKDQCLIMAKIKKSVIINKRNTLDYLATSENLYKSFEGKISYNYFIELTDAFQGYHIKKSNIKKLIDSLYNDILTELK
jgi:hypothetical protein